MRTRIQSSNSRIPCVLMEPHGQVHVYGPQCTDLTLIDLPGIVRFTGSREHESLGQDIKALINDYLLNDRCVILAVVPANVDFHNSEIMADARKVWTLTTLNPKP